MYKSIKNYGTVLSCIFVKLKEYSLYFQPARVVVEEPPLEENLNRIQLDGEVAQTVDEALSILG